VRCWRGDRIGQEPRFGPLVSAIPRFGMLEGGLVRFGQYQHSIAAAPSVHWSSARTRGSLRFQRPYRGHSLTFSQHISRERVLSDRAFEALRESSSEIGGETWPAPPRQVYVAFPGSP